MTRPEPGRVVVVAMDPRDVRAAGDLMAAAAGRGHGVDLVTTGYLEGRPAAPARVHPVAAAGGLWAAVERGRRRLAGRAGARPLLLAYDVVRPLVLWRLARRAALPHLDLDATVLVVVAGAVGVTTGWRLARRRPDLPVTTARSPSSLDAALAAEAPRTPLQKREAAVDHPTGRVTRS